MALERLSTQEALGRVTNALGDLVTEAKVNYSSVDLVVEPQNLKEVVLKLRDGDGIQCRFFTFLSAVDRSMYGGSPVETDSPYEVLIHLYSPDFVIGVTIHVPLQGTEPSCPSITDIFGGALWAEREAHEMFDIHFEGHPNLTHLYLPEDFEGFPLRKSFRLGTRFIKSWPGAKDPEEAASGGGRA